jgi:calcineurin-like phosphoesterase family protein
MHRNLEEKKVKFFTSDLHFGHRNIIKYCDRPYNSVEWMNEELVANWNNMVLPEDTVYVLGDFSLSKDWATKYGPALNGTKHLIAGNHDHCHPIHYKKNEKKKQRMHKLYHDAGFSSIQTELTLEIAGQTVKLHHMPYSNDHTADERYKDLRPKDDGGWLLHGHVHRAWKVREKQINVGVDVWGFKPVPILEIERIILGDE